MSNEKVRVKVVSISPGGKSALVECVLDGVSTRKYVPSDAVDNKAVSALVLERGIPYGYPWQSADIKFDGVRFANELHSVGLWTVQAVLKSPQLLWSALRATLSDNVSEILEIATMETKGVRHAK